MRDVKVMVSFILGGVEPRGEIRYKKKVIESKEERNNTMNACGL